MIVPVILSGGAGSRLWPLSRSAYPKQLLPLVSSLTMLQDTVRRAQAVQDIAAPLVICHQEHRFLVAEQLQQIGVNQASVILEPEGKNTAPATAIAALYALQQAKDPILLVLPADQIIKDIPQFTAAVNQAIHYARADKLVTFGIVPTHPETGYGYVKAQPVAGETAYSVEHFVEKPSAAIANEYLATGHYYWNSGMFMFKASIFLQELEQYAPDIISACRDSVAQAHRDLDFIRLAKKAFAKCRSQSIDYAVMEKTQKAVLVPLDAGWSDVGSWSSLSQVLEADDNGNVVQGDVLIEDVSDSYLRAESRILAVLGVKDHIVVETPDAVLVAHKSYSQAVKKIVAQLQSKQRSESVTHKKVYRPWGYYETMDQGDCFQVKRIMVKPGASLSLQMHQHRSEHWIVVKGIAAVTRGAETFRVLENQSTYIPRQVKHRLANPGAMPLEMIEVQSGAYLGEDDIVRFEDVYGRELSEE